MWTLLFFKIFVERLHVGHVFLFFKKNKDRMPRVRHRLMLNKTTIKIANRTER